MSNNLPSAQDIALARRKLEVAVSMAWGLYYVEDISGVGADILRKSFVEQVQGAVHLLGLELVERHPQPMGTAKVTAPIPAPPCRTIIEINHDFLAEIERDPYVMQDLLRALRLEGDWGILVARGIVKIAGRSEATPGVIRFDSGRAVRLP